MPAVASRKDTSKVDKRVRVKLQRFEKMKAEKQNWMPLFQWCAEYVMTRKQGFTTTKTPGSIQTDQLFDDTAPNANSLMTAAIIGAMWPNGAKSFRIVMPYGMEDDLGDEPEEIKDYYQWVTKTQAGYMDNPKAGLLTSMEEYMLDQGAFGTSGIMVEDQDDLEVPVTYRAVDAKSLYIAEGANGFVNTVYMEKEYDVLQLVEKYGLDQLPKKYWKEYEKGECTSKIKVLHAIEPRIDADPYGFGDKNMPYSSVHIEIETQTLLKESGFLELPVAVTRFWKAMGEVYGRCPAMNALPSIFEANALGEAWILAVEKTLDPPLAVYDDGSMGSGIIDTSAGAIVQIAINGRIGTQKPIEPLFLVGDLQWTAARRMELNEIIKNHFYQDRLMDLNNESRMTLGEANIRNTLRGQTLNTVYARQMGEQLVPLIETTFNKLRRRGLLGVVKPEDTIDGKPTAIELELRARGVTPKYIPTAVARRMASGQEVYRIEFISPATRIMQADELQGIEHLMSTTIAAAGVNPNILDIVDWDYTLRRVQELDGAPRETINSLEKIRKIRADRAALQQQQMEMEAARQNSETVRNMGQAAASVGAAPQQKAA